jgi:hypothetical protein
MDRSRTMVVKLNKKDNSVTIKLPQNEIYSFCYNSTFRQEVIILVKETLTDANVKVKG